MRKFLLSVCGLFLICAARAQGVEISVRNDADEALSYACLYVNGKAVAVTDSLGTGTIPAARLAIGDTLAVTYVGAEPQRAVYNEAMRRKGVWKVCLTEKYRTLTADEITVRADIEQLFRQSIRKFRLLHSPHTVTARFAVKYDGKSAEGRATATHLPGDSSETTYLDRGIYWYHMPLKIHPFSDTASIPSVRLHDWLHMGFHTPALALGIVERGSRYVPGIRYGYLGKRDDCRIFRISYPEIRTQTGRYAVQFIVWVGIDDKRIRRIETRTVYPDDRGSWLETRSAYSLSPINARTLVFDRLESVTPEGAVTLSEPEYASDRSEKRSRKRDK